MTKSEVKPSLSWSFNGTEEKFVESFESHIKLKNNGYEFVSMLFRKAGNLKLAIGCNRK
ncbi:MAG: hypothetical protein HC817_06985 [Saprospiraceae bacterium]|nr:hypothetical protein [Saprospiraceae bacterium]